VCCLLFSDSLRITILSATVSPRNPGTGCDLRRLFVDAAAKVVGNEAIGVVT